MLLCTGTVSATLAVLIQKMKPPNETRRKADKGSAGAGKVMMTGQVA